MSFQYLVLRRLSARNVNALPAWWFVGAPGPASYLGFAHALARASQPSDACWPDVAIIHHDFEVLAETPAGAMTLLPHQQRGVSLMNMDDYAKDKAPIKQRPLLSSQPTVRGHVTVTLVLRLPADAVFSLQTAQSFLSTARLAGGNVAGIGRVELVDSMDAVNSLVSGGFAVHERSDLMYAGEAIDPLAAVLAATAPGSFESNPWVTPAALGYALLTSARERSLTRDGYPHAFAEPLVGLIQYRSLREAPPPFWRFTHPHPRAIVASTL
jgi:CRISPR-associated protein Csy2